MHSISPFIFFMLVVPIHMPEGLCVVFVFVFIFLLKSSIIEHIQSLVCVFNLNNKF